MTREIAIKNVNLDMVVKFGRILSARSVTFGKKLIRGGNTKHECVRAYHDRV